MEGRETQDEAVEKRGGDGDREAMGLVLRRALLEEAPGDVAVDVDVSSCVGTGARVGVVCCAAEHGEDDGEGVCGIVEGDVQDGAVVEEGVDGGVVVLAWGCEWLFSG